MKKQKICIIGGSLAGLVTAIGLSKLNCEIDLITGNLDKNFKSVRTIALSENNFHFLNKLNISKLFKLFWIFLYDHFYGSYISPGCRNVTGKARNGAFRLSRYFPKKYYIIAKLQSSISHWHDGL